ncbi:Ulp1-like peptidase [Cucumis melo var. makuwa]|uniref:Ulp1-like peptidase n=1 Tax=Cucumis melo var. makuwa TaxID=1194695 RepID=A0A5D3DQE4_CUCMM|nr:Ulp1-like peptidase [Cucumis melo var. makuwa]
MAVPSDKYFPATVSCQVHKIDSLIKDKLTKEQLQMFNKTIFGPLLNVKMVFNRPVDPSFLAEEFNIITGLWPTNNPLEKDCDSKRLQSLLFGSENKKLITCLEIEKIFKNFEFTNDDDAVKVALAVFIKTVMVGKDKKTQFDMDILGRVDDEAFKSFDWSTFFYTRLLNSLKTSLQGKKEAYELKKTTSSNAVSYYNIKGYVLAFQVWAYEVLSTANEHLATRNSKGLIPRILRWNCTSKKSNDKEEQSHSKSYKKLKKEIKEVRKDLSTLTYIVCRMDDTITKQSLELYEIKQMLERLVQKHQQECGSDISIDGRDADLLMTIRDISDNLTAKSQKEKDLPQMITTLPLVSQPLAVCELAPLDQIVQIVNEESQLETTKQQVEIQKNDEAVTLVEKEPVTVPGKDEQEKPIKRRKLCKIANKKVPDEDEQGNPPTKSTKIISESTIPVPDVEIREVDRYNSMWYVDPNCIVWNHIFDTHLVTPDNNKAEWTDPTSHLTIWTEKDVEDYFNTTVGDYEGIPGWGDVNYVISCINIKEHRLAIAADMRKCKIYVFDSMPNYVEQKLVDEALQMPARCITSLAIEIGVNLHSDNFTYGPWPIRRSKATL